jgi:hypothetical protein
MRDNLVEKMEEVAGASNHSMIQSLNHSLTHSLNHSTLLTLSAFSVVQASVLQGEEVCVTA